MEAETKSQQIEWARAFTVLFELRARVAKGLITSAFRSFAEMVLGNIESDDEDASLGFDIDESGEYELKFAGLSNENLKKLQETLGQFSPDDINIENQKYIDASFVEVDQDSQSTKDGQSKKMSAFMNEI